MTISTQVAKSHLYNGNGVTTAFSTTFPFQDNSDLGVYTVVVATGVQTKLTISTHYTVSGAGSPSGGTVTITTPPATGTSVIIIREAPYTQTTDYVEGTSFPAETHEVALDKATMLIQQVKEASDRSLQFAVTSTNYPMTFPNGGTANAGKVIQWDSPNGTALINTDPVDLDLSLTGGEAITISGHYTIDLDINKQASLGSIDMLNDYMLIRDATDGIIKKVRPADILDTNLLAGEGIDITSNIVSQDFNKQTTRAPVLSTDYYLFYDASVSGYSKALLNTLNPTGGDAISVSNNAVNLDINKASIQTPVLSTDYFVFYDTSLTAHSKALLSTLNPTGGAGITVTNNVIDLDINKQSTQTPVLTADYFIFYDASLATSSKALLNTLNPTSGAAITVTSNVVDLDIMKQGTTTIDRSADYIVFYDSSLGGYRKSLASTFNLSQDTAPALGADLDFNGFSGVTTGNNIRLKALTTGDIQLQPGTSGIVSITPGSGTPTVLVGTDVRLIDPPSGAGCIGLGNNILGSVTGSNNLAIGSSTGAALTSGINNVALGNSTLIALTTGDYNVGLGTLCLFTPTACTGNMAIGHQSLYSITTGNYNIGIGYRGGAFISSGGLNTFIGRGAGTADLSVGVAVTTGSDNTILGAGATMATAAGSGSIAIGKQAVADGVTGTTSGTNAGGIAIGSSAVPVGFRGDNTPFPTSGASQGYLRVKINGTYYKIQVMAD